MGFVFYNFDMDSSIKAWEGIYTYFSPSYFISFYNMTDINILGYSIYILSPLALIIIGLALWITMIGVILIAWQEAKLSEALGDWGKDRKESMYMLNIFLNLSYILMAIAIFAFIFNDQ